MSEHNVKHENTFEYTYSAKRQEEIEAIRKKYMPKEEDKMELLRKLDKSVERPGTMTSIILGVVGTLILGLGMSFCMVFGGDFFVPGIIIGILGMAVLGAAYPVYKKITARQRQKLAPQILALTEELSK